MSVKGRFIKGGLIMAGSNILQQALLFLRNIVLALLLPPEQFGIALTLVTVISALDAVSELGIELFVVRSPKVSEDAFLSSMHLMLAVRGFVSALAMLLLADLFAWIFSTPEAVWAYRTLALVPLLKGFLHLDLRRFERYQNYVPGSIANLAGAIVGTLAAIVLAYMRNDYYAMLVAYILQTATLIGFSHFLAKAPYRLRYDKADVAGLIPYSTPLILNGILLFSIMQGDRILIGSKLGMQALASYGIISVFTSGITMLVAKLAHPLYLPILAEAKPGSADYDRRYMICGYISTSMAIAAVLTFGILGYPAANLAFGAKYEIQPLLIAFLGIQSGFKIIRSWPQIGLIAFGDTKALLYANIVSTMGIATATILIFAGHGLVPVAMAMAFGEAIAALFSLARAGTSKSEVRRHGLKLYLGLCIIAALLFLAHYYDRMPESILASCAVAASASVLAIAYINYASPDFYLAIKELAQKRFMRRPAAK